MRLVMIGYGKIARDQHVPAIAATPGIELVAAVSEHGAGPADVPVFGSIEAFAAAEIGCDAATHCNTPAARHATARATVELGLATLLEKPPFATLAACEEVAALARSRGVVLATSWHSQHNAAVDRARAWLAGKAVRRLGMEWIESARKWHPGQRWLWEDGGFGVFDPAINGFSILTRILPFAPQVSRARFEVPGNCAMPIAARLDFAGPAADFAGTATLDFRGGDEERWTLVLECDEGVLELSEGGRVLAIDGEQVVAGENEEYRRIYAGFLESWRRREADCDFAPLRMVEDAFALAERTQVADYNA